MECHATPLSKHGLLNLLEMAFCGCVGVFIGWLTMIFPLTLPNKLIYVVGF